MKDGYLTPFQRSPRLVEEIESNVNKLLDANLYLPLATKERNHRIESLKDTRDKTITKVSESSELVGSLFRIDEKSRFSVSPDARNVDRERDVWTGWQKFTVLAETCCTRSFRAEVSPEERVGENLK
jgi:hypothetical protein